MDPHANAVPQENVKPSRTISGGLQMRYFVLKPKGLSAYASASRAAILAYADVISLDDPPLAADLRAWVLREHEAAQYASDRLAEALTRTG